MKKKVQLFLILSTLFSVGAVRAGGLELDHVSTDAAWVLHFDVAQFKQGEVGELIFTELQSGPHANQLNALQAILQFDLRNDLDSVTLFGDGLKEEAVLVAHARVNEAHVTTLLKANEAYNSHSFGEQVVHEWVDENGLQERTYGAIVEEELIILAPHLIQVTEVLAQIQGDTEGLGAESVLAQLMPQEEVPFFVAAVNFQAMPNINAEAAILKSAHSGSLTIQEAGAEIQAKVNLLTDSAESAMNLQVMAQGLLAFAMMAGKENPDLARLAQMVQVRSVSNQLICSMGIPKQDLLTVLKTELEKLP